MRPCSLFLWNEFHSRCREKGTTWGPEPPLITGPVVSHSQTVPLNPPVPLSASELSLTEVRDKVPPLRRADPGLMPLPDTACGLEWSSLVNAAKAYEGSCSPKVDISFFVCVRLPLFHHELCFAAQRAVSLFSLTEPQAGGGDLRPVVSPVQFHTPQTPRTTPTFSG